jgi:hypothetical protein
MKIPTKDYETIAEYIQSVDSPVGIDAKKTHVYIIHTLHDIQKRLAALEQPADPRKKATRGATRSKLVPRQAVKAQRKSAQK